MLVHFDGPEQCRSHDDQTNGRTILIVLSSIRVSGILRAILALSNIGNCRAYPNPQWCSLPLGWSPKAAPQGGSHDPEGRVSLSEETPLSRPWEMWASPLYSKCRISKYRNFPKQYIVPDISAVQSLLEILCDPQEPPRALEGSSVILKRPYKGSSEWQEAL